jgi:imidazolonepropionase
MDYEMRLGGADYHQIAAAGGGIRSSVRAVRAATPADLEARARKFVAGFIRHGTTTIEAKSGYALDEASEMKTLQVLKTLNGGPLDVVPTYLGAHVTPPEYDGRPDAYIEWVSTHMLPRIGAERLAAFADVYCDEGAFTLDQARRYLCAAKDAGLRLKIHADQFVHTGGTRLAIELGAVSADHLEQANEDDARALAKSSTIATLLPGSVYHLGLHRYAPARMLIAAGATVALATDFNPGTSPTYSMPMVLSLACVEMRMTPAEAVVAATINGAHAILQAHRVGSLEAGKDADIIVLDAEDYREVPYHFGANAVSMTIKKGRVLYQEGEVAGL